MSRSLDIDQLKAFIAIGETGSFSRAAELAHRTQAAVSVQMKRLEESVGATLIERSARNSRLTPEGERLLAFAYRIVDLNAEAFAAMRGGEVAGLVRLGAPLYFGRLLPDVLADVAANAPEIELEIVVQETAKMLAALQSGELDLAIVTHQSGGRIGELVRREPMAWVCASDFNFAIRARRCRSPFIMRARLCAASPSRRWSGSVAPTASRIRAQAPRRCWRPSPKVSRLVSCPTAPSRGSCCASQAVTVSPNRRLATCRSSSRGTQTAR